MKSCRHLAHLLFGILLTFPAPLALHGAPPPSLSQATSAMDPSALDKLVAEGKTQQSTGLFVYEQEEPVRQELYGNRDKKIYLFSVTKLFTGMAVGLLQDQGLIRSVEEPVAKWYPEIASDPLKSRITLRHLLSHTSGIETTKGSKDIYPQRNFVKFALESPMVSTPGETFHYNNRAINIVSGIIQKASGRSMEQILVEHMFKPLNIRDYKFGKDKAGHTWAMDGLELKTSDLVKVGSMLSMRGVWKGRRILSERWINQMSQASLLTLDSGRPFGLSTFVYDFRTPLSVPASNLGLLLQHGADRSVIDRLQSIADKQYARREQLSTEIKRLLKVDEIEALSAISGRFEVPIYTNHGGMKLIAHSGDMGQVVIAIPSHGIAVARTIEMSRGGGKDTGFDSIFAMSARLIPTNAPAASVK